MAKIAQRYLGLDPWIVEEQGFHPDRGEVSESVFALGNEFMGVRGYFEEGYGGPSMVGSYFNGVYTEEPVANFFKGLIRRTHFIVNTIDWLYTRLTLDGETLDLATSRFADFTRSVDLRAGVLRRRFVWTTKRGRALRLTFERFASMDDSRLGCQRIACEPLNFTGSLRVVAGLDGNTVCHTHENRNFLCETRAGEEPGGLLALQARVAASDQRLTCAMRLAGDVPARMKTLARDKFTGREFDLKLVRGRTAVLDRFVVCTVEKNQSLTDDQVWRAALRQARDRARANWDTARAAHEAHWAAFWARTGVWIDGDAENQQGVRFGMFQLAQTYHGADPANNVTAKGLTGEAYWGVTWWDTETYCLPFYMFTNLDAARNLLLYRYRTLPGALERARQKDCEGARYPMCTIDGTEACTAWQHGDLEIHVSAAVAYGIHHYVEVTGDREFLYREGIEMLMQISRYYASRGAWSPRTGEYGFWFVMGPDEFHMGVNNNTYTNVLAKKSFEWTLRTVREMRRRAPQALAAVSKKVGLRPDELADWRRKAAKMRVLQDRKTGVYEQHDGYFDAPHVDCDKIPPGDFPLYHHWAYFRIFRWDMIKQPDVLLLHFFLSREFDLKNKRANFEYYEPRCSHESSLSPGVHSILAAELGLHEKAYAYWRHAARLDLDDYNRNTREGLHTTSMAAAWMNVVYGFGGMRSDGACLSFRPSLPAGWRGFGFRVAYRGATLDVRIDREAATFKVDGGRSVPVEVFGKRLRAGRGGLRVPMPADRAP